MSIQSDRRDLRELRDIIDAKRLETPGIVRVHVAPDWTPKLMRFPATFDPTEKISAAFRSGLLGVVDGIEWFEEPSLGPGCVHLERGAAVTVQSETV